MTYPTQPEASHFVNGRYLEDTAGAAMEVIYPATGEVIATLHAATPDVIEQALTGAQAAQAEWARLSGMERGRVLRRAADIMRARNRELSVLETRDTGKPLQETLVADATSGADALEYFGGLAGSLTGEHVMLPGGDWGYTIREPLGVCVGHRGLELSHADRLLEGAHRRWPAAMRWCSNPPRPRRFRR